MAKASKLPSGNWRVNLYLGKNADGKPVRRSVTGRTKKEAERNAATYLLENHLDDTPMTVGDAVDKYIMDASVSLSPSTIRGYRKIQKNNISGISPYMADRVSADDLQKWVNALARKYSAKTVRNIYGLVYPAISSVRTNFHPTIKLPASDVQAFLIPTDDDIRRMLDAASPILRKCIMLGAFCGLRRGEISYLRFRDLENGHLWIHGDMIKPSDGGWKDKDRPKTEKSNRIIAVPAFVLSEIGNGAPQDRIIGRNPDWITGRFGRLMKSLGMPYHFHLLRHYFASALIAQGVPKAYIQSIGGWEDGGAIDKVYTHILQTSQNEYSEMVSDFFSKRFP